MIYILSERVRVAMSRQFALRNLAQFGFSAKNIKHDFPKTTGTQYEKIYDLTTMNFIAYIYRKNKIGKNFIYKILINYF